jgi:hypothetical protein
MSTQEIVILNLMAPVAFLLVLAPLVWAAILDGRYNATHQAV